MQNQALDFYLKIGPQHKLMKWQIILENQEKLLPYF